MSDDAAVRAAAEALHRRESPTGNCNGHCVQQAISAVKAARPIIEAETLNRAAGWLPEYAPTTREGTDGKADRRITAAWLRERARLSRAAVRTEPEPEPEQDEPFWWNDPIAGAARGSEGTEPEQ